MSALIIYNVENYKKPNQKVCPDLWLVQDYRHFLQMTLMFSFLTWTAIHLLFFIFHGVNMRPILLISCPSIILCSSSAIHLVWFHNMHHILQFNPHHLFFFPSHKFDSLLIHYSFVSCLLHSPHIFALFSTHLSLKCWQSTGNYPFYSVCLLFLIIFSRKAELCGTFPCGPLFWN